MKSWKWLTARRQRPVAEPAPPEPVYDPKLPSLLHDHVQKGYDREIDDNESIWRSLPLFAVLAGLAGTFVNFLVGKAPPLEREPWSWVVWTLIISNVVIYGIGIRYLTPIVRRRFHRYIANDEEVRKFSTGLVDYYLAVGLSEVEADAKAVRETQDYLIAELAQASSQIQKLNRIKASARAQALFWLFAGFIFSIAISVLIIARTALSPLESESHVEAAAAGTHRSPDSLEANSAAPAIRRGGGEIPVPTREPGAVTTVEPLETSNASAVETRRNGS
ncbi:MAG TPA: hypothetical protein VF619_03085 [Allosphingosinicella sp.]|jgi:hypothetical protein